MFFSQKVTFVVYNMDFIKKLMSKGEEGKKAKKCRGLELDNLSKTVEHKHV